MARRKLIITEEGRKSMKNSFKYHGRILNLMFSQLWAVFWGNDKRSQAIEKKIEALQSHPETLFFTKDELKNGF